MKLSKDYRTHTHIYKYICVCQYCYNEKKGYFERNYNYNSCNLNSKGLHDKK